jgi:hypothetical protein
MELTNMTHDEWKAEGERLFGADVLTWRFVCPVCHYECSVADYKAAGAPSSAAGFSCVGRWLPKDRVRESFGGAGTGPCDYAGGGFFRLNPVRVRMPEGDELQAFAFAMPRKAVDALS